MGSNNKFDKRREVRKQRKHEFKKPKANSFLIVTEGKRTEPLYFRNIQKLIKDKIGGMVEIVEIPIIDIHGQGCSTGRLVEQTERIIKEAKIIYQNIWIVFDKDDFPDFNKSIGDAANKGYNVAWSNPSFEYWLLLHFYYSDSAIHRNDLNKKLDNIFKRCYLGNRKYQKNYEDIYDMVNIDDGVNKAIKNAKQRMKDYKKEDKPSEYNPGTMVQELVIKLKAYLEE